MSWFSFLQSEDNATPSTISPPLRRIVNFDNLDNSISANEIIAVKLNGKKINTRISSGLLTLEDDDSYLVVYQDSANVTFFAPVKSRIVGDVLYFKAAEAINHLEETSKYYAVYYGLNNLKYLNELENSQYQQESDLGISSVEEGDFFDLLTTETQDSFFIASENSSKSFQLALYDNGIAWLDSKSKIDGAKAFGVFDGPNLKIIGSLGPNYGKFKIRIIKVLEDNTFSKTVAIDWVEVDCFNREELNNQILFSTSAVLDYERYMFEIETLSTRNTSSTSNSVKISSYSFIPNYKIVIEAEEINPSIPFIRIGGIR